MNFESFALKAKKCKFGTNTYYMVDKKEFYVLTKYIDFESDMLDNVREISFDQEEYILIPTTETVKALNKKKEENIISSSSSSSSNYGGCGSNYSSGCGSSSRGYYGGCGSSYYHSNC